MTKAEKIVTYSDSLLGCPYVYGGTGKTCTPSYREARMNQYPKYADKIRNNCKRLKSGADSCKGCRWADANGKGKLCFDCSQFALNVFKQVGIPLVSGANSQWLKTRFTESGVIASLPANKVALVFRKEGSRMKHVAVYLGDGNVNHAKGHDYGVVKERLADVSKPFTHYGVPSGLYDALYPTLRKGNSGEYVTLMQSALSLSGEKLEIDGKFGANTETALKNFQAGHWLVADGVCGPKTWDALKPYLPFRDDVTEDETPPDEPDDSEQDAATDEAEELKHLREWLADIRERQEEINTELAQIEARLDRLEGRGDGT